MAEMTSEEYLYAYCQLILKGYSREEAKKIMEAIKEKMKPEYMKFEDIIQKLIPE
ncbi:hypothetical protein [Ureibacillus aquaedulcis]|uniref:Uncharacterized protein n=1 Tax=Ureibacillus aquaedulcis TaxID=3058421 RepID=A0ABT8GMD4_9BACL|nr:hypothetical protein [Ureibacillus sp. BA0131]MDN4492514.1 hypothetical protein [Ureibacillus sp. BA0131]